MKPILYLDVDGVLWVPVRLEVYGPAPGLRDFMAYVLKHFEVRWCTTWALSGVMSPVNLERLVEYTQQPVELWMQVQPSLPWNELKTEAIDWEEIEQRRHFVWLEDGLLQAEEKELLNRGCLDSYIYTNVLEDKNALLNAWGDLIKLRTKWSKEETC